MTRRVMTFSFWAATRAVLFAAIASFANSASASEEMCPLDGLSEFPYTDVQCQFYLGTTAYRADMFEVSAVHWTIVSEIEPDGSEYDELIYSSLGNLGFLTFYGYGVERDQQKAIDLWLSAAGYGHLAARKYLGYAYSDTEYVGRDDVKALAWYKTIVLEHPDESSLHEDEHEFYAEVLELIVELEAEISSASIDTATKMAHELLAGPLHQP